MNWRGDLPPGFGFTLLGDAGLKKTGEGGGGTQ